MRYYFVSMILLAIAGPVAAQTPLELVPEDAVASIALRDLDDLIKKGDAFIKEVDLRIPERPSELFDQGLAQLGIRKGYDRKAAAAITLMPPEKKEDFNNLRWLDTSLVGLLPFTDADEMADNFGFAKGKLKAKDIRPTDKAMAFNRGHVMLMNKHLYLCGSDKTLQNIQKSKSLASALGPVPSKRFEKSDVLVHIGRFLWDQEGGDFTKGILRGSNDPKEVEIIEHFEKALRDVQHTVMGFRLHDGIEGNLLLTVKPGGAATKLFADLRDKRKPSTLRGLPEGNLMFAQASSGDSTAYALATKLAFNFLIEDILISRRILHHVDRFTYVGVFNEVFRHVQSHRLAVYQNADEKKNGLFCSIAILDAEDAPRFVAGMRLLAKMATADTLDLTRKEVKEEIGIERLVRDLRSSVYNIRQSANTKLTLIGEPALPYLLKAIDSAEFDLESKRRARDLRDRINAVAAQRRKELLDEKNRPLFANPKLTFIANIEKREDVSIDVINVKIPGLEKVATHQYSQLLGPDWDKIRLAVVGNQIVVMMGSDLALFDATLRNLNKGNPGLAGAKSLAGFHDMAGKERQFEVHVSIEGMLRLVSANAKLDVPPQLTSVSLAIGAQSLQVDARVPMAEARTIARKTQEELMPK